MADENTMLRGCRTTCTPLPELSLLHISEPTRH